MQWFLEGGFGSGEVIGSCCVAGGGVYSIQLPTHSPDKHLHMKWVENMSFGDPLPPTARFLLCRRLPPLQLSLSLVSLIWSGIGSYTVL